MTCARPLVSHGAMNGARPGLYIANTGKIRVIGGPLLGLKEAGHRGTEAKGHRGNGEQRHLGATVGGRIGTTASAPVRYTCRRRYWS